MEYKDYWDYPDTMQFDLLKDINFYFDNLHDEVQTVFDSFKSLDGEINDFQRKNLYRTIEKHEEANYYDNHMLMLYMSDFKRRKHIKRDKAFLIMLFALFLEYYDEISNRAKQINNDISAEKYRQLTGKKQPSKLPKKVYTDPLPTGTSIKEMIDTEAVYRAERIKKIITANRLNDDTFTDTNTPSILAEFAKAKNALLKRSDGGGFHGILDTAMTNVVGYTIMQAAEKTDAETYTFYAVIDERTTPACMDLGSRTFRVSEMRQGYNVPPIAFYLDSGLPIPHPCRSWIVFNNNKNNKIRKEV